MLVYLPAAMSLVQLLFSCRETGALCSMKEIELFPDDPKSAVYKAVTTGHSPEFIALLVCSIIIYWNQTCQAFALIYYYYDMFLNVQL